MPRDIKRKEKQDHSIKKLDKNTQFTSRIKRTMIDQYQRTWRDKSNKEEKENSNATNYATTKLMRVGNRGARETTYAITGASKSAYNKTKMNLAEQRLKKKEKNEKKQDENKNTNFIRFIFNISLTTHLITILSCNFISTFFYYTNFFYIFSSFYYISV